MEISTDCFLFQSSIFLILERQQIPVPNEIQISRNLSLSSAVLAHTHTRMWRNCHPGVILHLLDEIYLNSYQMTVLNQIW